MKARNGQLFMEGTNTGTVHIADKEVYYGEGYAGTGQCKMVCGRVVKVSLSTSIISNKIKICNHCVKANQ